MKSPKLVLPIIVISQFCCTSLWFAGNGVMEELLLFFDLKNSALGHLISAVQFGFICGTLTFAIFTIADRFSPSKVFFVSALLGALCNLGTIWEHHTLASILILRFLTGYFLAGIYPIGMKIAADHYEKGLGKSLGFLVGALVLGTAFPHLLKDITHTISWKTVLIATSSLAAMGGLLMVLLVPDGPYRNSSKRMDVSAFFKVFKNKSFRAAAFGYFGHMWELYAFWVFVPVILKAYGLLHPETTFNIPLLSFMVIGIGCLACIASGYLSLRFGEKKVAFTMLLSSCICCLLIPFAFKFLDSYLFITFLLFWGIVVIADSPLFSTLVAQNAMPNIKGTALTIVNCIGFSITIVSIQLLNEITLITNSVFVYIILALGPVLGLLALGKKN